MAALIATGEWGAETTADNNNTPVLVKTTQVRILNFDVTNLPHFLGLDFLRRQLSKHNVLWARNLHYRPRHFLKKCDLTSQTSTCEHPGLQCNSLDDWHKNLSRCWKVQKSFQNCSALLTLRTLFPLSYSSLSAKTTVWLLHINWPISLI